MLSGHRQQPFETLLKHEFFSLSNFKTFKSEIVSYGLVWLNFDKWRRFYNRLKVTDWTKCLRVLRDQLKLKRQLQVFNIMELFGLTDLGPCLGSVKFKSPERKPTCNILCLYQSKSFCQLLQEYINI